MSTVSPSAGHAVGDPNSTGNPAIEAVKSHLGESEGCTCYVFSETQTHGRTGYSIVRQMSHFTDGEGGMIDCDVHRDPNTYHAVYLKGPEPVIIATQPGDAGCYLKLLNKIDEHQRTSSSSGPYDDPIADRPRC